MTINIKKTCANKNGYTPKARTIEGRQFGLIAEHLVCFAWIDGQYFYRGANATAHIKTKPLPKLVQAWLC